jgi:hypothetical protein
MDVDLLLSSLLGFIINCASITIEIALGGEYD